MININKEKLVHQIVEITIKVKEFKGHYQQEMS